MKKDHCYLYTDGYGRLIIEIMTKKILLISLLILASTLAFADDEYAFKDIVAPNELYSVDVGGPFIATKKHSRADILYNPGLRILRQGDFITQLSYKGYNPGKPFTRHFVVWISNTERINLWDQGTYIENKVKVFEGDCTIPAGGNADERITLLTIPLEQPFEFGGFHMRMLIESTGDPVEQDVCFEQNNYWGCLCSTADEDGGQWSQQEYSRLPLTTFTVATPVFNLTGTVMNQDKRPVPNATIQMRSTDWPTPIIYAGDTDSDGRFSIRIEDGNKLYHATVSAPYCATYTELYYNTHGKEMPQCVFTLYDAVEYKAGRRATIIMPVTPDASAGRYFRLDRREDDKLIFEREFSPQANIPYIIFPDKDFVVDLKPLDLTKEAGKTSVNGIDFIGSYVNTDFGVFESEAFQFLDETPDIENYGRYEGGRIAALRAYLFGRWYIPQIVYHDDSDGISSVVADNAISINIYDLQGRRINGKPTKGVYIESGRKTVVR